MIRVSFFRNPEIKKGLWVFVVLSVVSTGIGFLHDKVLGLFSLCLCIVFTLTHFVLTYHRYLKIAEFTREIDGVLHGAESIDFGKYSEGELAILESEISKLTIRLREQAEALKKDKTFLADSIADISHQIRTPLTSINILVSLLLKPKLSDERRIEIAKELELMLLRIDWLITALLKMSRIDAGVISFQQKTVPVAELIKRAIEPIAIPMELRGQQIDILMEGSETFIGDLAWSVEAIGNILKNCMEHTPNGGRIAVKVCENAIYTEIEITDNGLGIDKEDLPHLFERFYKGKNSGEQSIGIGLALARMIIMSQNGTVKAQNNRDGGARFTVRFYKGVV
ncbi:sensor histidine kinase [Acetivibrio straminisolvens]|uniref:sensor histidine kinase n=1 Tax=Acetivibrio straminisolvens TaxID=253314 RepID=UPI00056E6859|nr:HAMP domain-containing sensor histidine kinase [Acetivibrio straminisolvens]